MQFKKRDGLICTIFHVLTCGIYGIYFWYRYGEDTNEICREDGRITMNYIAAWILSMLTCGIFGIYWRYQLASRLDTASRKYQVNIESPVFFTIFMYIPVLGYLYACDIMNKYSDAYGNMYGDRIQMEYGRNASAYETRQRQTGGTVRVSPGKEAVEKETPVCGNCGEPLQEGKGYCMNCGYPTTGKGPEPEEERCPSCGRKICKEDRFCIHCGQKLEK